MIPMKRTPLSQLASVSAGQGAPKDNEFSENGMPFVRAGSLEALIAGKNESELELVSAETAKLRKLKTYPKGTILFAKSGMSATKDRIYVLQNPAHVVSHLATLIPKDGAHVDYLRLALKRFPPSSLIKDPAYPAIGLGEIEDFEISVPEEFDDQIRIAHLLGKVEGLIAQRKQHLQQLDDLLKSVFLEMFGDPVRNEKGWTPATIGELANDVKYGTSASAQGGQYKYLRMNNITENGYWDFGSLKYIDVDDKGFQKYSIRKGDLVFNRTNSKELVGKTAVYDRDEPVVIAGYLIRVRFDHRTNPWFVWGHLNSKFGKTRLFNLCRNIVGMANINSQELKAIPILKPPVELQNQFAEIVEKVEGIRSRYQQSLTDLDALYGALSQQAFKGELDLSRIYIPQLSPVETELHVTSPATDVFEPQNIELPELPIELSLFGEKREKALQYWFDAALNKLPKDTTFQTEKLIDAINFRLIVMDDQDREFDGGDYEVLKKWIFDALINCRLKQSYDDSNNCIQLMVA